MNLDSRLSRLEASQAQSMSAINIVASDEAAFVEQFESALLSLQTIGTVSVSGSNAGVPFTDTLQVMSHEDALEMLQ